MYSSFAVNKYLRTVASGWIFINIKMDLHKGECEGMDWVDLVQDRDR